MNTSTSEDEEVGTQHTASDVDPQRRILLVNNRLDSRDVFVGTREITILHGEESYRLRLTSLNKLILTK